MDRRDLLAAAATLSVGLAGCLGTPDGEDRETPAGRDREPPTSIEEVSLVFMSALLDGNVERMREFLHTDSPLRGELADHRIDDVDADLEFIDVEVVSESGNEAVADVSVLSGERNDFEQRYRLRLDSGDWRIFDIEPA
ncbi:hypothetical protein [Halovenus marina]|uniref:hypothetical protein n=1 Tax=Halovenus marina TaxID=3396621 RepID=UPI003F557BEE